MVYGPNEPSSGSYAIVTGIFLKRKKDGLPLLIHGDGSQTRDFVHVDDICYANILAMNNDDLINETINVGTGEMISIKELANMISTNQINIESRKIDLKNTLCDINKLKNKLNWIPTKKIKDYIENEILKS
jgi:nucleoside-diphosphate-sugar epimerase